jgi:pilus assembly protein CpaE
MGCETHLLQAGNWEAEVPAMAAKQRVLVIDDDPAALRLTGYVFQRAGYEVHLAANGADGLSKAEQVKPDLVILDVMMPDMSGLAVCQRLRSKASTARVPIIMLSAKSLVGDKVSGFQVGADDYVAKPVDAKELLARAGALLHRMAQTQPPAGRIVAVVGAKGGVGVTTVAVNVGVTLAAQGRSAILAELRPCRGTAAYSLNLNPPQDLGGLLAMSSAQIDRNEVTRRLVQHTSGLRLLASPQAAAGGSMTEAHLAVVLGALASEAEFLILDLPGVTVGGMRYVLGRADQVLLVTEPEIVSLTCARADMAALKAWGVLDRMSPVVVSRSRSTMLLKSDEVEAQLGMPAICAVPPAPEVFHELAHSGVPIVTSKPGEPAAGALTDLSRWVSEKFPAAERPRQRMQQ